MEVNSGTFRLSEKFFTFLVKGWRNFLDSVWPFNHDFNNRLLNLKQNIKKIDPFGAERLGIFLDELLHEYKKSPANNRGTLRNEVFAMLEKLVKGTYAKGRFPALWLDNLQEVHVSCEPCLELLGQEVGRNYPLWEFWRNKPQVKVTYYVHDEEYRAKITERYKTQANITVKKLTEMVEVPFFIFKNRREHGMDCYGFRGLAHPKVTGRLDNDVYQIEPNLSVEWLVPLTPGEINGIKREVYRKLAPRTP